ncbi:hypothetical protein [Streptomyces sp. AS02]|uniref:hypothetical protein n=1 Tax=Streptomyces sp. AS02 TaxID=2938946 RepID=UPI00202151F1|nr:hypothetical protein [Streptomyces sp. AS02]MCL8015050.1 hypothetical protein [Streptomyces sp. AS02]
MKRKSIFRLTNLGAVAGLALSVSVLPAAPAHAVTFVPCGNVAALRAAITASNTSNENIVLAPFCTYTITNTANTADGGNGLPSVTGSFSISGFNVTVRRSAATGTPNFRVFNVESGGDLTLSSIHVRGGRVPGNVGGGIRVSDAGSTLTVRGGSIRDNDAGFGGGIRLREGGSAVLLNTLVSGNDATGSGGGISHAGSSLRVDFSRVLGNTAGLEGGGIRTTSPGVATLRASVVTGNTALGTLQGGGIYEGPNSQVTLDATLVSNNTPNNCRPVGAVPGCAN